jgi:transcriptional regulator with XRE-family HTH domain
MSTLRDIRHFPGLLADLRERAGWSQSRLAVESGLDSSFICKLESGQRQPSRDTIAAFAEVLELDADDTGRLFISANYLPDGRWVWFSGWCIRPEQEVPV